MSRRRRKATAPKNGRADFFATLGKQIRIEVKENCLVYYSPGGIMMKWSHDKITNFSIICRTFRRRHKYVCFVN